MVDIQFRLQYWGKVFRREVFYFSLSSLGNGLCVIFCDVVCLRERESKINFPYPSVFELTSPKD